MSIQRADYNVPSLARVVIRSFEKDPLFCYLSGDPDFCGEINTESLKLHSRRLTDTLRNGLLYKLNYEEEVKECGGVLMIFEEPKQSSIGSFVKNSLARLEEYWCPIKYSELQSSRLEAFMSIHNKYYEEALRLCGGRMLYLEVIAVLPTLHGKGFGKKLMQKVLQIANDMPVFLECTDTANIPFYRKYGFEITASAILSDNQTTVTFMLKK